MKALKKTTLLSLLLLALSPLLFPLGQPKKSTPFSIEAIYAELPYHPEWEAHPLNEEEAKTVEAALSQPYHYLGSGGQCFTFASADDRYVIKFIKQKAFALPSWIQRFPAPFLIDWLKQKKTLKKEQQRARVFSAFRLSLDALPEETGLVFVHLNPTRNINTVLSVSDAKGGVHELDLDNLEFVLQKKAVLAYSFIDSLMEKGDLEGAKRAIDELLQLNVALNRKGFRNRDPNFRSNCGFIGGHAVLIDMGRMVQSEEIKQPANLKKEIKRISPRFRKFLAEKHPQLLDHFDNCIAKILETE
ncbi:MAG: hypothetical protein JSS60_04855 [Verrucomicrobia bacterium]|nr:hypothetical protein [Verrucomicrobiota bacterium]